MYCPNAYYDHFEEGQGNDYRTLIPSLRKIFAFPHGQWFRDIFTNRESLSVLLAGNASSLNPFLVGDFFAHQFMGKDIEVVAMDRCEIPLDHIQSRLEIMRQWMSNRFSIRPLLDDVTNPSLLKGSIDVCFEDFLFECCPDTKQALLAGIRSVLADDGVLFFRTGFPCSMPFDFEAETYGNKIVFPTEEHFVNMAQIAGFTLWFFPQETHQEVFHIKCHHGIASTFEPIQERIGFMRKKAS